MLRPCFGNASRIWGGAELQTERLVRGLAARGHEPVLLCRFGSPLHERLRGAVPCEPILGGADLSPIGVARCITALRRHRPDALMAMTMHDPRVAGVAARLLGIPVIIRQAFEAAYSRGLRHRVYYHWVPSHYATNARATRDTLLRSAPWLLEGDVSVVYNGMDTRVVAATPPAGLGLPDGAIAIGFVARLEPHKGVAELAAAWPRVAASVPEAHLVVVGAGSAESWLQARLARSPRVHWLGFREDPIAVIRALDVLVHPSHVEGMPNAVMEAMAAHTAVVATHVSGIPELVEDAVSGRLVAPRDPAALAAALIQVAGDATLRERMAEAGVARIARDFTLDRMLDEYEELFVRVPALARS